MSIRTMAVLLAAVLAAFSTTSTHDDPIIIRGGSVILNFGLATKAFANSGMWAEQVGGKWVYYQHTHMGTGTKDRMLQALGQAKKRTPLLMEFESQKLLDAPLDLAKQRQTRIEIFLKGVPVGGTQAVALPDGPQIVLEAVDLALAGSNPHGYKGVPCCAHPGFLPATEKGLKLLKEKDGNQTSGICKELQTHAVTHPSELTWAWKVTANRKLEEAAGGPTKKPGNNRYFVEAQYKDPAYQSVTLDSYSVGLTRGPRGAGMSHLSDRKGKKQNRVPFGMCPALELCATEPVNGKSCELSTRDCKVAAGFDSKQ